MSNIYYRWILGPAIEGTNIYLPGVCVPSKRLFLWSGSLRILQKQHDHRDGFRPRSRCWFFCWSADRSSSPPGGLTVFPIICFFAKTPQCHTNGWSTVHGRTWQCFFFMSLSCNMRANATRTDGPWSMVHAYPGPS